MTLSLTTKDVSSPATLQVLVAAAAAGAHVSLHVDESASHAIEFHAPGGVLTNASAIVQYLCAGSPAPVDADEWLAWENRVLAPTVAAALAVPDAVKAALVSNVNRAALSHLERMVPSGATTSDPSTAPLVALVAALQKLDAVLATKASPASITTSTTPTAIDGMVVALLVPVANSEALHLHHIAPHVSKYVAATAALPWFQAGAAQRATAAPLAGTKRKHAEITPSPTTTTTAAAAPAPAGSGAPAAAKKAGGKKVAAAPAGAAPTADVVAPATGGDKPKGEGKKGKAVAGPVAVAGGAGVETSTAAVTEAVKPKLKKGETSVDLINLKSLAPISVEDEESMRAPIAESLIAFITSAIHTAFPSTVGTGIVADLCVPALKHAHHYQCNSPLLLANKLKGTPDAVPSALVAAAKLRDAMLEMSKQVPLVGQVEVGASGFLMIFLAADYLAARAVYILTHGVKAPVQHKPHRVLVDYSSPNIAKDMHIGHLRSTIIGDTIAKILEYAGHDVMRVNHVGDWGTQFGMLIAHLKDLMAGGVSIDVGIADLTTFYKEAKKRFDADPEFKVRAHKEVVALQAGDAENLALWQKMIDVSQKMYDEVYSRLKIDSRLQLCGESFYNNMIPPVIREVEEKGLTSDSDGALVVRIPGHEVPLMVRKGDGGYGYDSTDMAAIKYRLQELKRDWIVYVVDAGQQLHFDLVFKGAQLAGWYTPATARVEHTGFGVIQGEDGKKFKTRSGDTVRLTEVLDEAKARAKALMVARLEAGAMSVDEADLDHAAAVLGYGGVKYFDLRQNRLTDYVFSYERMLSPDGDTAVYSEYAHARLKSILRKAASQGVDVEAVIAATGKEGVTFHHPTEVALVNELSKFGDVVRQIEADLLPHHMCGFLFDLGGKIANFHRDCNVLSTANTAAVRDNRLRLVKCVADVMATSLQLLGITPLDRI